MVAVLVVRFGFAARVCGGGVVAGAMFLVSSYRFFGYAKFQTPCNIAEAVIDCYAFDAHRTQHMSSDGQRIEVLPGRQQVRWKVQPDIWGRVIRWMLGVASFWA